MIKEPVVLRRSYELDSFSSSTIGANVIELGLILFHCFRVEPIVRYELKIIRFVHCFFHYSRKFIDVYVIA